MKKNISKRFLCVFLAVSLFLLAGCAKTGQEAPSSNESQKEEQGSNTKDNTKDDKPETESDGSVSGEKDGDSKEPDTEGYAGRDYTDIILDRSLVEGKLAVYFLRSDIRYSSYTGSSKGGDSVLLIAPDGTTMLYDCSTALNAAYIVYAMQRLGITKLDYFVNSHPHVDHLGGFSLIAEYFEIGQVYMPPTEEAYMTPTNEGGLPVVMMNTIKEKGIPYSCLVEGDQFQFGSDITVKVYNPPADLTFDGAVVNENEWSLALKFIYKDSSVLLAGDCGNNEAKLGRATENEMVAKYGSELQADVAKMNHHGDGKATKAGSAGWIDAVNAKLYVGMSTEVTDETQFFTYMSKGAKALHTGIDGTVLVYTTGDGSYEVQTEQERYTDYFGSSKAVDGHLTIR